MKRMASVYRVSILILLCLWLPCVAPGREWTDAAGNSMEAEYVSASDSAVMLKREGGQALRVELSQLSEADREFVAKQLEAEREGFRKRGVVPCSGPG